MADEVVLVEAFLWGSYKVLYSSEGTFPPSAHGKRMCWNWLLFGRLYMAKTNVRHIGSTGIASRDLKDQLRCSAHVGR